MLWIDDIKMEAKINMKFMALLLALVASLSSATEDKKPLIFPGQINIGLLIDIYDNDCSRISKVGVQQLMAAVWTTQMLNSEKRPEDLTVGIHAYDSCGNDDITVRQAVYLADAASKEKKCNSYEKAPLILGAVNAAKHTGPSTRILNSFAIPSILTSDAVESKFNSPASFSIRPSSIDVVQSIVNTLKVMQIKSVVGIGGSKHWDRQTLELLSQNFKVLDATKKRLDLQLQNFLNKTVVLVMEPEEANTVISESGLGNKSDIFWLVVSSSGSRLKVQTVTHPIVVSPVTRIIKTFDKYFENVLLNNKNDRLPFMFDYHNALKHISDTEKERFDDIERTVRAVSALYRTVQSIAKDQCHDEPRTCLKFSNKDWHTKALDVVGQQKLYSKSHRIPELFGASLWFDSKDGGLKDAEIATNIVNGENATLLSSLELDTSLVKDWLNRPSSQRQKIYNVSKSFVHNLLPPSNLGMETGISSEAEIKRELGINDEDHPIKLSQWVQKPTVWVTFILSILGLLITIYVTVFMAFKLCDKTLGGNQALAFVQLLAIKGMFVSAILITSMKPMNLICINRFVISSTSTAIAFGVIVVKAMQFHSLIKIGLGGRLNQMNQFLTLGFIVAVQIPISYLPTTYYPDYSIVMPNGNLACYTFPHDFIQTQIFLMVLTLLSLTMSLSAKRKMKNNRESQCYMLVSGTSILAWIVWAAFFLNLDDYHYRDVTISSHIIIMAYAMLAFIYGPKMVIICRQRKNLTKKSPSNYAESISTLFSNLNDIDTFSLGTISLTDGSLISRATRKSAQYQNGSSASRKIPKSFDMNIKYPTKDDNEPVVLNPLYEPSKFQTFR